MPSPASNRVTRVTVDLAGYPDLVVIYLGMKARGLRGVRALAKTGRQIAASVAAAPDGLLGHENFLMGVWPLHVGFRQYWRDFATMEHWTRTDPHAAWWMAFLRDSQDTGFWHETYRMRGGIEAIYDDMTDARNDPRAGAIGLGAFAPVVAAKGRMFGARARLGDAGTAAPPPVTEEQAQT
jgi:hypothetical protein